MQQPKVHTKCFIWLQIVFMQNRGVHAISAGSQSACGLHAPPCNFGPRMTRTGNFFLKFVLSAAFVPFLQSFET
jgi:hypothetical protein